MRADYAEDLFYTKMGFASLEGWKAWNVAFGERIYHQVGMMYLKSVPLQVRSQLHISSVVPGS